jgi:hypothetical protein
VPPSEIVFPRRTKILFSVLTVSALPIVFTTPPQARRAVPLTVNEAKAVTPVVSTQVASHWTVELRNGGLGTQGGDPFSGSFQAPPTPAQPISPPPTYPLPAPVPYRFAGTVLYDGQLRVLMTDGDRIYEAKVGDIFEHAYRIESADDQSIVVLHASSGTTTRLVPNAASSAPENQQPRRLTFDAAAGMTRSDL